MDITAFLNLAHNKHCSGVLFFLLLFFFQISTPKDEKGRTFTSKTWYKLRYPLISIILIIQ